MKRLSVVIISMGCLVWSGLGCAPERPSDQSKIAKKDQKRERKQQPVAAVNGEVITLEEFERRLNGLAPYARMRYTSLEKKQAFLESMVVFEVLADQAEREGFQNDPAVIQAMKETMVRRYLAQKLKSKVSIKDISDADVQALYDANIKMYTRPELRRAAVISVPESAKLTSLLAEVTPEKVPDVAQRIKVFRRLAVRHSADPKTSRMGGDIGYLQPPHLIKGRLALSQAVFNLSEVGEVSPPVKEGNFWHAVMYLDKKPAQVQPIKEVTRQIRTKLYEQKREAIRNAFIKEMRDKARVEIFDDAVKKAKKPEVYGLTVSPKALIPRQPVKDLKPKTNKKPSPKPNKTP